MFHDLLKIYNSVTSLSQCLPYPTNREEGHLTPKSFPPLLGKLSAGFVLGNPKCKIITRLIVMDLLVWPHTRNVRENLPGVLGNLCSPDKGTGETRATSSSCFLSRSRFLDILIDPMVARPKPLHSVNGGERRRSFRPSVSLACPHLGCLLALG